MSPQTYALLETFQADPQAWIDAYAIEKQLLPEIVSAEQVGNLVAWLLSSKATAITGQAITIDAGTSAMIYERETS